MFVQQLTQKSFGAALWTSAARRRVIGSAESTLRSRASPFGA
jgi:hypothetical protein